jgi:hypothetical protein
MGHEVVWEEDGLHRRFWGELRACEYAQVQAAAYSDLRFDGLHYILVDFLGVTEFIATNSEAEEILASTVGSFLSNPKVRVAVVTRDEKLTVVLDQLGNLSPYPVRLFRSLDEARTWLGTTYVAPDSRAAHF